MLIVGIVLAILVVATVVLWRRLDGLADDHREIEDALERAEERLHSLEATWPFLRGELDEFLRRASTPDMPADRHPEEPLVPAAPLPEQPEQPVPTPPAQLAPPAVPVPPVPLVPPVANVPPAIPAPQVLPSGWGQWVGGEAPEKAIPGWSNQPAGSPAVAAAIVAPPQLTAWPPAPSPKPPAEARPGLFDSLRATLGLPTSGEGMTMAALQAWLEGRLLAVVGGVALILGAILFLSLAFTNGWITEPMRVLIGLAAGAGLLVLGEIAFDRLRGIVGPVLVAVGLAVISIALLAATRTYGIVPVEAALVAALLAAVAAAVIAIRHDSQLVAAFGLIAVLAAPPLVGASPTVVTLAFVAAALIGTTAVALFRTWNWLPPLAFTLTAPQLATYVTSGPSPVEGMVVVGGFWLVNLVAAGGEEIRHASDRLRTTTVSLLLADVAYAIWAGFQVLQGPSEIWRGSFVATLAVAHLLLGLWFAARYGDRHAFGQVVLATGLAALTMAIPIQFGGTVVPIAWSAEAVALTWVAVSRRHPGASASAIAVGSLAIGHLVTIEYAPDMIVSGFARQIPFIGPEGLSFAFVIGALALAIVIVPVSWIRVGLAAAAGLVAIYVFPFELSGPALVAGWTALAAAGAIDYHELVVSLVPAGFVERRFDVLGLRNRFAPTITDAIAEVSRWANALFIGSVVLAGLAALGHLIAVDYPITDLLDHVVTGIPFLAPAGLSLALFLLGLAAVGWFAAIRWVRLGLTGLGFGLLIYSATFEVALPVVAVAWGVLAVASLATVRRLVVLPLDPSAQSLTLVSVVERMPFAASALGLAFLIAESLGYATPEAIGLHLQGSTQLGGTPFLDEATFVLVSLAVTALACGRIWGGDRGMAVGGIGAAAALAWLLPLEIRTGYAVAGWSALGLGCVAASRRLPGGRTALAWSAVVLIGCGALVTLAYVAPPSRLVVDPSTVVLGWPLLSDATVALGSLAIAIALGGRLYGEPRFVAPTMATAGALVVYLLSVAVVDRFQAQVGSQPLDALQKEAQVALSVLWSGLGAIAFAVGIASHRSRVRLFGLVLLGIATTKVFLVDLAFLDVAYRVLSLVALGIVLLVSAAIFSRTQRAPQ